MLNQKYIVNVLIMFVAGMAAGFVVHHVLLHDDYAQVSTLYRPESDMPHYTGYMLAAHFLTAAALVWIYRHGKTKAPFLGQGIRFGIAIASLYTIPVYLIYFAVQPMPAAVVLHQIIYDGIATITLCVLLAWLEKH